MENTNLETAGYPEDKNKADITAFFACSRELINGQFTNTRDVNRLHFGQCLGEVDKKADNRQWKMLISEEMGFFLRIFPWLKQLLNQKSPIKLRPRLDYAGSEDQALDELVEQMLAQMQKQGRKKLVIFIHGMEQPWSAALVRAIIFAYTLRSTEKHPGLLGYVVLALSWPSDGNGYGGAIEAATATIPGFRDKLLPRLIERIGAENIVIIDHSMGGLIATAALKDRQPESDKDRFFATFSVAPDKGADDFDANDRTGFIASTQKDHVFVLASLRDLLMLLSECVHMGPNQVLDKYFRFLKGVKLAYPDLRRLEHLRLGQILKLPRWPGLIGVDYTLADGLSWLELKIFRFVVYLGWGHSIPYSWIKRILLLLEQGNIKANVLEKLEHTQIVDKPGSLPLIVAKPQTFGSIIEMLDA